MALTLLLVLTTGSLASSDGAQVDVSNAPGAQNESSIAIDPSNPAVLVAASQDVSSCGIRVYGSSNGGASWSSAQILVPHAAEIRARLGQGRLCAANEWVAADETGSQYVLFIGLVSDVPPIFGHAVLGLFLSTRPDAHSAWSIPRRIDASLAPGDDDKPVALVDVGPQSPHKGRLYVAWTRISAASPGRKIIVSYTDDRGATWSAPQPVGPVGSWGARLAVDRGGDVYVSAWSGRTLWASRSTDGSPRFGPVRPFHLLSRYYSNGVETIPAEPAEPVHPDAALAVDTSSDTGAGTVYAAASLPSAEGRRIVVTSFHGDLTVATRSTIAIRARGAYDEFNPAIEVDSSTGIVWACFYATGTGKHRVLATYSCVTSGDRGRHWSKVIRAATMPSNETLPGTFSRSLSSNYASYEGLAVARGVAHPIWTDTRELRTLKEEIYTARLSR